MTTTERRQQHTRAETGRRLALCIALIVLTTPGWSSAATRTWRGTGVDAKWSNPDNWVLNLVPADGDDLEFPVTVGPAVTENDIPNLLVHRLVVTSTRTLTGAGIRLQDGMAVSGNGSITVTLDLPIQLAGAQNWSANGANLTGTATATVDLNGSALTFTALGANFISLSGVVSGTGELIKEGNSSAGLSGNNTFAGPVRVNAGSFGGRDFSFGVGDGTAANGTTIADGASLSLGPGVVANEAVTFLGGGSFTSFGVAEWAGPITVNGPLNVTASALADRLVISGVISGPGSLRQAFGHGPIILRNTNTYTGGTTLGGSANFDHGPVSVEAHEAIPSVGPVTALQSSGVGIDRHRQSFAGLNNAMGISLVSGVAPDEHATLILSGSGTSTYSGTITGNGLIRHTGTGTQVITGNTNGLTGSAIVEHGTLELRAAFNHPASVEDDGRLVLAQTSSGTMGALDVTGGELVLSSTIIQIPSLSLTNGSLVSVAQGNTLGRLTVLGPLSLGNSTLAVTLPNTFTAPVGTDLILIDHAQAGPVTGTFSGLPEGAEFVSGTHTFRITYVGGDGNDVLLKVTKTVRDYLLSEGATGGFFTTDILIANPSTDPVPTKVEFFPTGGAPISVDLTMPPLSRKTIRANDVAGLAGAEFSTQVHSLTAAHLVVERTMTWDATGYGAHTEHAAEALSTTWYFAEGSQGFFSTYLLLANPNDTANSATVRYLRTNESAIERTYPLTPRSRRTVDIGADAELVDRSFGMIATFTQPGMAERAMYFGTSPFFSGGHESAGVTAPSPTWFVAEGATGPFFETFILLSNPGTAPVDATLTFLPQGGSPVMKTTTIPGSGRTTINIEQQDASLSNAAVATEVNASAPIVVERAQYWPDPAPNWYEAHNSFGVTTLGTKWGLAEGRVGLAANYQTYILLANPLSTSAAEVTITFLRDGKPSVEKEFVVPATTRLNVPVGPGTLVPELVDETFGALITSTSPIAVERAMYSDAAGVVWAAGTSATAVPIP